MSIFNSLKEPVFLKEENSYRERLETLKNIKNRLNNKGQKIIDRDIKCLEYGESGEQNIVFELKNSHMPMYVMQDIYIEHDGLTAQIDFIIVTAKLIFLIECKNLYGNIEINDNGDFIRTINYGNMNVKEGIYSPVSQNKRHMELLKIVQSEKRNKITAAAFRHWFYDNYKSIVVLANPKTVLKTHGAKKEIREQVIRADRLIQYIQDEYEKSKNAKLTDRGMLKVAESILCLHKERAQNELNKYKKYFINPNDSVDTNDDTVLYEMLRKYRINKSGEENNKPYFIFNNRELDELVKRKPVSKEELFLISGFGNFKTKKYGDDIINIIRTYLNNT